MLWNCWFPNKRFREIKFPNIYMNSLSTLFPKNSFTPHGVISDLERKIFHFLI